MRSERRRGFAFTVAIATAAGACAGAEDSGTVLGVDVPVWEGVVDLTIGEMEGADPYVFGRLGGIVSDSLGRIFAVESQAGEVRVFDSTGAYAFTIGREGGGPGELRFPCCPTFDTDGALWVRNQGNRRYERFAVGPDGTEFLTSVRMRHNSGLWAPVTFDTAGRLIDIGHTTASSGDLVLVRWHVNADGSSADSTVVRTPPSDSLDEFRYTQVRGGGRVRYSFSQPFGARHLVAHGLGGSWADAVSSRYAVRWRTPDGRQVVIAREVTEGPPLSERERQSVEDRITSIVDRFDISRRDVPFTVPERKPPLRGLYFDALGRLWVELTVADTASHRVAHVYGPDGEVAAEYRWPASVPLEPLGWIESHHALGVTRDSLDVQRIARIRWHRGR